MLIWQFPLNPLISKHGFVKLNITRAVSAAWKSFACFLSSPGFWMSRGCGSWLTVCPSHWGQTAQLKCEGWNHTSKSNVPAQKLSEHNIWLDEVIKKVCPNPSFSGGLQLAAEQWGEMANRKGTWTILDTAWGGWKVLASHSLCPLISNNPFVHWPEASTDTNKGCNMISAGAFFSQCSSCWLMKEKIHSYGTFSIPSWGLKKHDAWQI